MGVTIFWSLNCLYNLEDYLGGNFGTVETVLLTIAGFLGVIGNLINVLILHKKELRSPVAILVFFLSIFDFMLCAGYLIIGSWALTKTNDQMQDWKDFDRLWKWFALLIAVGYQGSCYITAGIALERLLVVYRPFSAIITIKTSFLISFGVILIVTIQTLIGLFFDLCYQPQAAKTTSMITTFIIPFACSTISNVFIIWKVFVQGKKRAKLTSSGNNNFNQTTKLLVIIISINILSLGVYLSSGFIFEVEWFKNINKTLRILVPFLLSINSGINVILYSVYSRTYLKNVIKLLHIGRYLRLKETSSNNGNGIICTTEKFGEE